MTCFDKLKLLIPLIFLFIATVDGNELQKLKQFDLDRHIQKRIRDDIRIPSPPPTTTTTEATTKSSPSVVPSPSSATTTKVVFDEREEESTGYGSGDKIQFSCATNEVYSSCVNSCPASCEEPDKPACRNKWCWSGCECKEGFVKEHQNWSCVPKSECPTCGANEHFRDCGSACVPTCTSYQNMPGNCHVQACQRGCFCDYGYVRDMAKGGKCVHVGECSEKCGPNEYLDQNGPPCVRTPDNPRPKCLDEEPRPACRCNTGFVRNQKTGKCQPIATNFIEKCPKNETFSYCGSECAVGRCHDEMKKKFCPTICQRGCFCKDGFVRDDHNGQCVRPEDCFVWKPEMIDP